MTKLCPTFAQPGPRAPLPGLVASVFLFAATLCVSAPIPAPEKILPDDTLILVTTPDFAKFQELGKKLPLVQLWNDPAMRPFKEKFMSKWTDEFVKPVERDLDIKFDRYTPLLQGQLTFAVTQNGWQGQDDKEPGLLLLIDAKDKADQLKKNLADLRKKWTDAGRTVRSEKIRDTEFSVLTMTTNDVPPTLRKLFPKSPEVQELGEEKEAKKEPSKDELFLGQVESLLILGNSGKAIEKVVARLSGGSVPSLGELSAYQPNHQALFREAPLYCWVNAKVLLELFLREANEKKENPDAPNPFDVKPEKVISATGLDTLKTFALSFQPSSEGAFLQVFLGVPEANRQGLFKILAGEAKDTKPPTFVPADVLKFQRWRLDGQKTWTAVEKIANDISPQFLSGLNFLLDTANTAAKDKDPGFDIRKNLIANIGDDMITYEKAPRGGTGPGAKASPSLFLVGSANAEQLAAALKSILVFFSQQAGTPPQEREFLGRKIYSVSLRGMGLPMGDPAAAGASSTLNYAASGGYLALSTDAPVLEEYLRSSESQVKALRELPGLDEAAQKVLATGSSLFGYQNQAESMRATFDTLRKVGAGPTNATTGLIPGALNLPNPTQNIKGWMDFSLLPEFDRVAKYFGFSVYGGTATSDGLAWKMFAPTARALRAEQR